MHHDVHQISAFIRECFMARALGVDPLKFEVEFDACEPESFLSFGPAGSWPASDDVGNEESIISRSTDDYLTILMHVLSIDS